MFCGGVTETPTTFGCSAQNRPSGKPDGCGSQLPASPISCRNGSAWVNAFIMFSASAIARGSVSTTLAPLSKASSATGSASGSGASPSSSISTVTGEQSNPVAWKAMVCLMLPPSGGASVSRVRRGAIPCPVALAGGILTHARAHRPRAGR